MSRKNAAKRTSKMLAYRNPSKRAPICFEDTLKLCAYFLMVFVTSLVLFRTLLNRNLWMNPLSNVMGGWGLWETVNGERKLTTECIENVIMMVPFSSVVMWTF